MRILAAIALSAALLAAPLCAQAEGPQASPATVLQLWLQMKQLARSGTPYATEMQAMQQVLPEAVTEDVAWKQLARYAEAPPTARSGLEQRLRLLSAPDAAPATPAQAQTVWQRVRAQLAQHISITPSEAYADAQLRKRLRAHAENGELMSAARLIGEKTEREDLRQWQQDYARYQTEMHLLASVEGLLRRTSLTEGH